MDLGLQGKGALVMSSYSRGRGFGIAEGLAADGCRDPVRKSVSLPRSWPAMSPAV